MSQALQLAAKGLYHCSPNPRVGCVLVKDIDGTKQVIGIGYHQKAGLAHAEVNALNNAAELGFDTQGATAYVTLEPCSHQGKTPPCAKALIAANVARVVVATVDPNPEVSGRGIAMLERAGIEVVVPLLEDQASELNKGFMKRMSQNMPWVFAKVASSLDGRTAMASGESQWITGSAARVDVQRLRAKSCAIVTGVNSILADDSRLTVRDSQYALESEIRQPLKVVLDSSLRTPLSAKVLADKENVLLVYLSNKADAQKVAEYQQAGIKLWPAPMLENAINLKAVLAHLASLQCNEVMVEAGATLTGAFLQQGLLDELVMYVAPTLLGNLAKPQLVLPLHKMSDQQRLNIKDCRQVGDDLCLTLTPIQSESA